MDNPRDDTPTKAYRDPGMYTVSAVAADDDTKGMEADFKETHLELKAKERELEDLQDQQSALEAVLAQRDRGVDTRVRSWELAIFDIVNKKRDDARYQRHVPEGLRAITEAEPRKVEPSIVRKMLKTMDEDKNVPELKDLIAKHSPLLLAAVQKVDDADKALNANEDAIDHLEDVTIPELKRTWVSKRTALFGLLTAKFPTDSARVESYFKNFGRPRKKKKDAAQPATPPAAPASPDGKKDA